MRWQGINRRLRKMENALRPTHDGCYTLEELCRTWWRQDKVGYLENSKGSLSWPLRYFIPQFEREDADRAIARR
jgi:hypothetical protein